MKSAAGSSQVPIFRGFFNIRKMKTSFFPSAAAAASFFLSAFGKDFSLDDMVPNDELLAPHAKVLARHAGNVTR